MSSRHTVVQGEHLSGIAKSYGFASYKTIWDHGENAALKQKRQNPSVLFPGDVLFVPDKGEKEESRKTEAKHRFELKTERLTLRLVLEDLYEKPIANARCELRVENQRFELTTDSQGKIEKEIKPEAQEALLTVKDNRTSTSEIVIPIKIGHLDPVTEETGQKARLNNLGYFAGPVEGTGEENKAMFLSAVEEFQCDHHLVVDGECGPNTQTKLKQVHGC